MKKPENGNRNKKRPHLPTNPWVYILIALALVMVVNMLSMSSLMNGSKTEYVEYSKFLSMVDAGQVQAVEITDTLIRFTVSSGMFPWRGETTYATYPVDDPNLVQRLYKAGVEFGGVSQEGRVSILSILINLVLPLAFYGLMIFWIVRMIRGSKDGKGGGFNLLGGFGKSGAKMYNVSEVTKRFSDVAGQDEAKDQLIEMVDFLNRPEKYKAIGAKLPKGALLVGPPGTGKTLLAQAVAGEAKVPFFFVSGSAFVEMFVGTGAARVRDLFKEAAEKAPCIVFIDEIDAIGKKRDGTGLNANDEREQTLNQLLAEMDGFDPSKGIIILGATNRPEILDKALLRPGRFDRRITVDLPDMKGREAILRVHAKNIVTAPDVDLAAIARATVGASGADLANIINEGALCAVRAGRTSTTQSDLEAAVELVIAGSERKSMVISPEEKRIVAYHEIGHALVAARQKHSAPVHKITIIPRTNGALGYTMQVEETERVLMSRDDLEAKLVTLTAGRAAEEFVFHTCTTGAANDIEQATKIARNMVTRFGMSSEFGMVALDTQTSMYLGDGAQAICSPETSTLVDKEIQRLIQESYNRALEILRDNAQKLSELSTYLLEKETISGEEFMDILGPVESGNVTQLPVGNEGER